LTTRTPPMSSSGRANTTARVIFSFETLFI
jgi:hypothetical protein